MNEEYIDGALFVVQKQSYIAAAQVSGLAELADPARDHLVLTTGPRWLMHGVMS